MAFNGFYNTQYVPQYGQYQYGQNMAQPVQPQTQSMTQASNGLLWCQGESGAKSYMVAPGNSVVLMDSENSVFYIKSVDASGMPLPLRIFDYTERNAQQGATNQPVTSGIDLSDKYVTRDEYNALLGKLEAMRAGKKKQPQPVKVEHIEEEYEDAESFI